jgi:hypothetical protein
VVEAGVGAKFSHRKLCRRSSLILATIHVESLSVTSLGTVEAEGLKMILVGLQGIEHSTAMTAFEKNTHLVDIHILPAVVIVIELC